MRKINILGWILLPFNIVGLWFCAYSLQPEISLLYLLGTAFFVSQFIYIIKTLKVLKQFDISKNKLESAARNAAQTLAKLMKDKNENR